MSHRDPPLAAGGVFILTETLPLEVAAGGRGYRLVLESEPVSGQGRLFAYALAVRSDGLSEATLLCFGGNTDKLLQALYKTGCSFASGSLASGIFAALSRDGRARLHPPGLTLP